MKKPAKSHVKGSGTGAGGGPSGGGGKKSGHAPKKKGFKTHGKPIVPHHPITHHVGHAKPPKKAKKPRKWSPGSDVACCSAEALGTLLGWDWQTIVDLYWRTSRLPNSGATILDSLIAAHLPVIPISGVHGPCIIGVQLEEPHAIAVKGDGSMWSWGEPFQLSGEVTIEERWAVLL
jgi:hypothetical protein